MIIIISICIISIDAVIDPGSEGGDSNDKHD